jgi:hypothetical protein
MLDLGEGVRREDVEDPKQIGPAARASTSSGASEET